MSEELGSPEDLEKLREAEARAKERLAQVRAETPEPEPPRPVFTRIHALPLRQMTQEQLQESERRAWAARLQRRQARIAESMKAFPALYSLDLPTEELRQRIHRKEAITDSAMAIGYPGIVWVGASGSGKTSLACATARLWVEQHSGGKVVFARASQLATASRYHGLGEGRPELIQKSIEADLLLIDEIGEPMRTAQWDDVAEVVFSRYERDRPTWVTTWLTLEQMCEHYGKGFARRLFERSVVIDCGGAS